MQFRWQLAIFDEQFEDLVPIEEYLRLHREGKANWIPSVEDSGLFLEHEGIEWMASEWNLGRLDLIILQFEDALLKLKRGNLFRILCFLDLTRFSSIAPPQNAIAPGFSFTIEVQVRCKS